MALDDDARIDPATLPENVELIEEIDATIAESEMPRKLGSPPTGEMRELMIEALGASVEELAETLVARRASHPLEDDLRTGLALNLARTDAAVFTEAKLRLQGWTPNLGGSDVIVVGRDGAIVLIETKWESVWQSMWDILKLASGHRHPRVAACYAVYAAKPKEWATQACAKLFEPESHGSKDTQWFLEEHEDDWARNLSGSPNVHPTMVPGAFGFETVFARAVDCLGTVYEVRAISVRALPSAPLRLAS